MSLSQFFGEDAEPLTVVRVGRITNLSKTSFRIADQIWRDLYPNESHSKDCDRGCYYRLYLIILETFAEVPEESVAKIYVKECEDGTGHNGVAVGVKLRLEDE